ncbi:hypothetical protein ACHAXS_014335, partial [Conticribra weissflogii]
MAGNDVPTTSSFWKPSHHDDDDDDDHLLDDDGGGVEHAPSLFHSLEHHRQILPIAAHRTQILYALETYGVVVLVGATGSGKSTQLPLYLYENGWADDAVDPFAGRPSPSTWREILIAQPKRIAAQTLARHLSRHFASTGRDPAIVGHSVRFSNDYRPGVTKIRCVTDGYLLREILSVDPLLARCSVLVVDEAHERSANTDLLLGAVKRIRRRRPELRVVVCSATLDAEGFLEYFTGGPERRRKRERERERERERKRRERDEEANDGVGANDGSEGRVRKRKSRWGRVEDATINATNATNSTNAANATHLPLSTLPPNPQTLPSQPTDDSSSSKLDEGTIISVDGRQYPVDILYIQEPVSDYVQSTVEVALRIHASEQTNDNGDDDDDHDDDGDILCFLPTGEDIGEAITMAETILSDPTKRRTKPKPRNAICLPLYGSLPPRLQSQPFLPRSPEEIRTRSRRIVFATNIAETSVTVPNVAHVVDCGFAKLPFFDPSSGFHRLLTCPISRASADQRAGRAGRVRPGKCYRLYSEEYFRKSMEEATAPEVRRCDWTALILTVKALGVTNALTFDWMTVPTAEALAHGLETLFALGVVDEETELTELGKEMVYFPTDPRASRMILAALDMESRFLDDCDHDDDDD